MAEAIYLLCAVTSVACAGLLLRNYRRARMRLILWTAACFGALALQNVFLFVDLVMVPDLRLGIVRNLIGLGGVSVLLYGLISDTP